MGIPSRGCPFFVLKPIIAVFTAQRPPAAPHVFQKILTICTGNICRSPLAEEMLRQLSLSKTPAVEVRSAGIGALQGAPADDTVQRIAQEHGLQLDAHRGQQVTTALTRWADLILVMEPHHLQYILRTDPTARGKTFLLGHWLPTQTDIADPYRKSEDSYRQAHTRIAEAVQSWRTAL
jgi:protein-tyrosine phosphatase